MQDQMLDQPVAAEHSPSISGMVLWEIIWQRKAYVALGAVIGLVAGVLFWATAPKKFESKAQIWVLKKQPDVPVNDMRMAASDANPYEDFLTTHRTLLQSKVVVGEAIAKGGLANLETFHDSIQPVKSLTDKLTVTRDRDKSAGGNANSQILNISFRCRYEADASAVLTAVIDSYREFLNTKTEDSSQETYKLIEQARDLLQNELEKKEQDRDKFLAETPVLWKTQFGTTMHQERLVNLDTHRMSLRVHLEELRATLKEVETAQKEGRSPAELLEIVSSAATGQPKMIGSMRGLKTSVVSDGAGAGAGANDLPATLEQELIALKLEEGKLLQVYGHKHPKIKTLHDRIQTVRALLTPTLAAESETPEQRRRNALTKENLVSVKITQLKREAAETERNLKSLDALYEIEKAEARRVFPYASHEESLRRGITRSEFLYDTINQRLRELKVVKGSQGYDTHVISPPSEGEKVFPRGSLVLPVALLLGLVLGCGLAFVADMTDKSFRSAEDVRRQLGLPIMGVIPLVKEIVVDDSESTTLSPTLFTWHRPKSHEAEAYRGVRTALYFSTHGQGRRVIQVTSPNQGDGKSTTAANIAISIVQSGKSVLIVDADLRRPQVGRLFGIDHPQIGFASVLGGLAEIDEAIVPTGIPNLSVLPAGPVPPNPAELLTGTRLHEALEMLRERYDYVIVDTPPLFAVTDPSIVGPQVDGVILTLRMNKKGRIEAKRAKENLDNLGVNIFGVVLNGLDQTRNKSGYGHYGNYYGYGYYGRGYYEESGSANGSERSIRSGRTKEGQNAHDSNGASPVAER